MAIAEAFPGLDDLLANVGAAGSRIRESDASEAGAGNLSLYLGWDIGVRHRLPLQQEMSFPCRRLR